ncbi:YT521-B-like domain-containing protein [Bisporella sp. PMI_857]|nr:YT521-B-like domain-containing protein [Bisporella sp. PMI_857]
MAFIWVQVWAPTQTLNEVIMGDTPLSPPSINSPSQLDRQDMSQYPTSSPYEDGDAREGQQGSSLQTNRSPSSQFNDQHNSPTGPNTFDMNHLGHALPELPYQQSHSLQHQRYPSAHLPRLPNYPQNASQFPTAQGFSSPGNAPYNIQYQNQYQGAFPPSQTPSPPHLQAGATSANQFYQNQMYMAQQQFLQNPAYYIQPGQYSPQNQMYPGFPPNMQYGSRSSFPGDSRQQLQHNPNVHLGANTSGAAPGRSSIAPSSNQSTVVRGPPRKPRQSGHAIWIGNLPPQTELMSLVLHVCKEAPGLESLFLISKSNCAFANYKDEAACAEAQGKIHDSRFQTVRLVSRLRRSSVGAVAGVAVPTGPAVLATPSYPPVARSPSPDHHSTAKETKGKETVESKDGNLPNDKFFVVKSLTVEDLELSVRNGIWATQSHNEESLNKAYEAVDNVYLIFSANKSGEYFGYARMASSINEDPAAAIEFAPKAQVVEDPELPRAIPTSATEFAPKGRIIDDSARGTIFWEAEREDEEEEETDSNKSEQGEPAPSKAWGKPFKIEWISTTRLPFYRTRGLRNPWNSNREVKIARDGTELETSVGRRLLSLFHRNLSPISQTPVQMPGMPIAMPMTGYPGMRPFQ